MSKLTTVTQLKSAAERVKGFVGGVIETVIGAIEETEQKIPTKVSQLENDSGYKTTDTTYTVTIPVSGWKTDTSVADYPYYYEISASSVTANDLASVIIAPGSQSVAMACGMCPTNETLSGKIKIRARNIPAKSISAEYSTERRKGI